MARKGRTRRRSPTRKNAVRRSPTRKNAVRRSATRRSAARKRTTRRSAARKRTTRRSAARKVTRRNRSTGPRRRMVRSQEISGFEGESPKRKRNKSSRRGKKAPSKYNLFMKRMSPILRRENPGVRQPDIMKMVGKKWKEQKN